MDRLSEVAALWGIESDYYDARGHRRILEPEALARIVEAVAAHATPPQRRLLPPTIVLRKGRPSKLDLPDLPQGSIVRWTVLAAGKPVTSGQFEVAAFRLPDDLAVGMYRLRFNIVSNQGETNDEATLLVAPEHAYQGDGGGRLWALAVQLYSVRSHRNWGIGDFTDLRHLVELAAKLGAAGIGLNPLHALFDDRPELASPYAANSRLFLNPLYIDVAVIPEFPGLRDAGLDGDVQRLRAAGQVDYAGVAAAKLKGLRLAYDAFRAHASPTRRQDFFAFCAEQGQALAQFAGFEVLRRRYGGPWWDWPPEWRCPSDAALNELRGAQSSEFEFYEFVQWIADRQLGACRDAAHRLGLPIGLYLDVAVGVDSCGADAWSEQTAVLTHLSVGAPPDLLNTAGQNWGLAGFNPAELVALEFAPFRRMLAAAMRHAGAIRLDHVLGLKRLFVIPHGMHPSMGAYLHFPFEPLLAVIAQESVHYRSIVIGEDLGTVPEGFRETMADWGLWSYRVMMFERGWDGSFHPPERYPANALVTFSTHDLPTLTGWLASYDLAVKRGLGIDPGETDEERARAVEAMRDALGRRGLLHDGQVDVAAVTRYLALTPSRLLVVSLEDVLEIKDQPNVPGTTTEHANWRQRLPVSLEDWATDDRLLRLARILAEAGRANPQPQTRAGAGV
ncbi:MAG: 4-alpha-glucanotransferase [Xanthobacteraceae bacterium]